MPTFWLSFAPKEGPARVILIDAPTFVVAHALAHRLGMYRPGDETWACEIPEGEPEHKLPRGRQLTAEELKSVDAARLGDVNPDVN